MVQTKLLRRICRLLTNVNIVNDSIQAVKLDSYKILQFKLTQVDLTCITTINIDIKNMFTYLKN